MKLNGTISINEVLAKIEKPGAEFSLGFVRATGPKKGSIKYMPRVRKGAPKPNPRFQGKKKTTGVKKHRIFGTLPFTDIESGNYMTPLISHIVVFDNKQVIH